MATTRRKSSRARKPKKPASLDYQPGGIDHALLNGLEHPDLPPVAERMEPEDPNSAPPSGGFLKNLSSGLQSLLSSSPKSEESETTSETPSPTSEARLSPEVEADLQHVPDVVADENDQQQPGQGGGTLSADGMQALMGAIAFEEQDVKDTLAELFDYLSEAFDSEHWTLTERQLRMLGRPTAQLLNSLWAKLKERIPDALANWCETTPGAMAFATAFGLVVVPKAAKQWNLSRERKQTGAPAKKPAPVTNKQPIEMQPGPGGIPVAVGVRRD